MVSEDHRLVFCEQLVEIHIAQTMGMLAGRLQLHQVDDVDHADPEVGQVFAQDRDGGERLQRGYVPATGHHHIGRHRLVVACPLPDADTLGAVLDGCVHRQPLRRGMFSCNYDIHVMMAAQAVVHHR